MRRLRWKEVFHLAEQGEVGALAWKLGRLAPWALGVESLAAVPDWDLKPTQTPKTFGGVTPPSEPGSCLALFSLEGGSVTPLDPGIVLPLAWVRRAEHATGLPSAILDVARDVKETMLSRLPSLSQHPRNSSAADISPLEWNLYAAPSLGLDELDISDWPVTDARSAWVSLAGAYYVAASGGTPRKHVFASATWDLARGISSVGQIELKIGVLRKLGLDREARLYLAAGNMEKARSAVNPGATLELKALPYSGDLDPLKVLADYLADLEAPPRGNFQKALEYAQRRVQDLGRRIEDAYYIEELLPNLATQLGRQFRECGAALEALLVVLNPRNMPLAFLLARAVGPPRILGLHTGQADWKDLEALGGLNPGQHLELIEIRGDGSDRFQMVDFWSGKLPPGRTVAVDLTGGTKLMSVQLAWAGQALGWRMLYLTHKMAGNLPMPGGEQIVELTPPTQFGTKDVRPALPGTYIG